MQDVFDPRNNSGQRATIVSINRDGVLRFDPSFIMFNNTGYNKIWRVATRHKITNGVYEDVTNGVFVHHRIYLFHVGSILRESISRPRLSLGVLVAHIAERTLPGLDGESSPNHADLTVGKLAPVDDNVSVDGAPDDGSIIGGDGAPDDGFILSGDGAEALDVSLHGGNVELEVRSLPHPVSKDNDIGTYMFDVNNDHFYTEADKARIDEIAKLTEAMFTLGQVFDTVTKAREYAQRVIGDKFGFKYSTVGPAIKCMNCEAPRRCRKAKSKIMNPSRETREQKEWRCGCLHKITTTWFDSRNRANDKRVKITGVHGQHSNDAAPQVNRLSFTTRRLVFTLSAQIIQMLLLESKSPPYKQKRQR